MRLGRGAGPLGQFRHINLEAEMHVSRLLRYTPVLPGVHISIFFVRSVFFGRRIFGQYFMFFLEFFLETVNFLCVKMGPEWAGGFRPIGTTEGGPGSA